jgi:hypothetical protein
MSESVQQPDTPAAPQISLRLRILFFAGDPLFALGVLTTSILTVIAGTTAGRWEWTLAGIGLAVAAMGLFFLVLLISLDSLNGWAREILSGITSLHSEEMQKLAGTQRRSAPEQPMSPFKN